MRVICCQLTNYTHVVSVVSGNGLKNNLYKPLYFLIFFTAPQCPKKSTFSDTNTRNMLHKSKAALDLRADAGFVSPHKLQVEISVLSCNFSRLNEDDDVLPVPQITLKYREQTAQ